MSIWEHPGGGPIVNAFGQIIECDECPCVSPPCFTFADINSYYDQFSEMHISVAFQNSAGCPNGNYSVLSGDYILDYLADWSSVSVSGNVYFSPLLYTTLWVYQFPAPVEIYCSPAHVQKFNVTHIIGAVAVSGSEVRRQILVRGYGTPANPIVPGVGLYWQKLTDTSNPDPDCVRADSLPPYVGLSPIPNGDAEYELFI